MMYSVHVIIIYMISLFAPSRGDRRTCKSNSNNLSYSLVIGRWVMGRGYRWLLKMKWDITGLLELLG